MSGSSDKRVIVRTCFIVAPHCGQAGTLGSGFEIDERPIKRAGNWCGLAVGGRPG